MMFLAIAGAVMSFAGAAQKANAEEANLRFQQAQYKAQADANAYNAAVAKQRAESAQAAYGQREEQQRRENRLLLGKARAAAAESHTGLTGTNADVLEQNAVWQELDALNIRYAGDLEATALKNEAGLDTWQQGVNLSSADYTGGAIKRARTSGYLGMAGSLLSSAGNYFGGAKGFGS